MVTKNLKERLIGATGSVSGVTSVLGSWQGCHNVCLGLIVLLGILGITIVGMPLLFLTKVAVPFWIIAVIMLGLGIYIYTKKQCISKNLLFLNSGLIIAGTPFQAVQSFQLTFWIVGGALATFGIGSYVKDKISKNKGGGYKNA